MVKSIIICREGKGYSKMSADHNFMNILKIAVESPKGQPSGVYES